MTGGTGIVGCACGCVCCSVVELLTIGSVSVSVWLASNPSMSDFA